MPPRPDNAARTHHPRGPSGAARGCEALLRPENHRVFRMILAHYWLRVDGKRDECFESCFGGFAGSKSAPAAMGGHLPLAPEVSSVRYPSRQRTFKYVATVQSVTDEACHNQTFTA